MGMAFAAVVLSESDATVMTGVRDRVSGTHTTQVINQVPTGANQQCDYNPAAMPQTQLIRSSLFVPGHKPEWVAKAIATEVDEIILDLEDAVPDNQKAEARGLVRASLEALQADASTASSPIRTVRVNGLVTGGTFDDLEAIVCPALDVVILPKVESVEDMAQLDTLLAEFERRAGCEPGRVQTTLAMETALAMRHAYNIAASSPRVNHLVLACGRGGDAARAVGYQWTPTGEETMYLRSKAVLDARAAGIAYPTVTSWWDIPDLDGLRRDAELNRRIGFRGMMVMHPSHVAVVNEVFNPSQDEIAHAQGLLEAMAAAEREGSAATIYEGDLVDYAMVPTARELLELAERLGMLAPAESEG